MLRQQDSPKSNYGTRLASKDSAVIDAPSCTWSACAGCSGVIRGTKRRKVTDEFSIKLLREAEWEV